MSFTNKHVKVYFLPFVRSPPEETLATHIRYQAVRRCGRVVLRSVVDDV